MFEFPKTARLLRATHYTDVFRQPDLNLTYGPLRLRARKNRTAGARLGLVVTKKGTPKAFRRNRLKRLIRESFRHEASTLPSVDIVVQVFAQIDDDRLCSSLAQGFDRIRREIS